MALPYILIEKSVVRKPNSTKTITEVLDEAFDWMQELQAATSVDSKFFYAEVVDSETLLKFNVYSSEAKDYFDLESCVVELGGNGTTNGATSQTIGVCGLNINWDGEIAEGNFIPFLASTIGELEAEIIDSSTLLLKKGKKYSIRAFVGQQQASSGIVTTQFKISNADGTNETGLHNAYNYTTPVDGDSRFRDFDADSFYEPTEDKLLRLKVTNNTLSGNKEFTMRATIIEYSSTNNSVVQAEMPAYSTEEVLTTERWIDGKPIYRKIIERDSAEVKGDIWKVLIDYSHLNVDNIVCGEWGVNNGIFLASDVSSKEWVRAASFEQDGLRGLIGTSFIGMLRGNFSYTKTTDTAESPVAQLSIAAGSDVYSEEETLTNKVWLGKAVYRKVLTGTTDNDANDVEINPEIGVVEICKVIDFSILDNSGFNATSANSLFVGNTGENRSYAAFNGSLVRLKISNGNDPQKNNPYTITIEYTKI